MIRCGGDVESQRGPVLCWRAGAPVVVDGVAQHVPAASSQNTMPSALPAKARSAGPQVEWLHQILPWESTRG